MYESVKKTIKSSEGFSNRGYFLKYKGADGQDIQENFMTIEYGHKCVNGDPYQPNVDYSTEQLDQQFEKDFTVYLQAAERYIGDCQVPEHIKEIIIETAYNIGEPRLFMFKNMRAKMQEGNWQGMAAELRDSKLYRTLTSRYEPLAKIIEET